MKIKWFFIRLLIVSAAFFVGGCASLNNRMSDGAHAVYFDGYPSNIKVYSYAKKEQKVFHFESNGNFWYGESENAGKLHEKLIVKYGNKHYKTTLNYVWDVLDKNYRVDSVDNDSEKQVLYVIEIGDKWNLLSFRVLIEDENNQPQEIKVLMSYLDCAYTGKCLESLTFEKGELKRQKVPEGLKNNQSWKFER